MDPTVRFIAEFMDGVSRMTGSFPADLIEQADRAAKRAKLDPNVVDEAVVWLATQDRI